VCVCVCVCMSQHNSGTPGAISTKLGTYIYILSLLFLDNPLHVILNKSKLAYRNYVILIANKQLKKHIYKNGCVCVNVCVCSSITLERLERFYPNLVHILLHVCVRILCI
jgi:hypothetical protein